jgi:type IV pilus assembly protein PilV
MEKLTSITQDTEDKGFTLLEVMIAIVIMAIGLLGAAAMQMNAINGNAFGMKLTEATERVEDKIELLRNVYYDEIVNENEATDADGFTRQTIVQEDTPITDTKTVEVRVSWADNTGVKNHQIAFRTIITKP